MSCKDYLVVDRFLRTELDARALALALSSGLVDRLCRQSLAVDDIPLANAGGRRLLRDLLEANEVIAPRGRQIDLAPGFLRALAFRDLLEAKLAFAAEVSDDLSRHFPLLLGDPHAFMAESRTFQLFRYDLCFEESEDNLARARRWMRLTTALTRYEGRVLAERFDLADAATLLDVGGNSGELALQLRAAHPRLAVTVLDLPVVCRVGREHVARRSPGAAVTFVPGDLRRDVLPGPFDAVTIKSLLHDWPDADASAILARAAAALAPGGRLAIFERAPLQLSRGLSYAQLCNLVFFSFFREADLYLSTLHRLGFTDVRQETLRLDTDFHLITARRGAG